MALKYITGAHQTALKSDIGPSTKRFYLDSRQVEYPPLSGHNLAYDWVTAGDNQPGSHVGEMFKAITNELANTEALYEWSATNCIATATNLYLRGKQYSEVANNTSAAGYISFPITAATLTSSAGLAFTGYARAGVASVGQFTIVDTTSSVNAIVGTVDFGTQTVSTTTGTTRFSEWTRTDAGNEEVEFQVFSGAVLVAHAFETRLYASNGTASTDTTHWTGAELVDNTYPLPYVATSRSAAAPYYVLPMPTSGQFSLRIAFRPGFNYDVGVDKYFWTWYVSATQYFIVGYVASTDLIFVQWYDGGTARTLVSQQYDDGSAESDINAWIVLDLAIDLTTGDTTGSQLWTDRTSRDTAWSGNIDAKSTNFPLAAIGHLAGASQCDSEVTYVWLAPDKVITDADVQTDWADITEETIAWNFNDEGVGRTRYNITDFVESYNHKKAARGKAATLSLNLYNDLSGSEGCFSDDQYAAFVPESYQFNGLVTQKYLQGRCRVEAETWNANRVETFFTGRVNGAAFSRRSGPGTVSRVAVTAEDSISDIARSVQETAVSYDGHYLCHGTESTSLFHEIARLATERDVTNYLANSGMENAVLSASWANSNLAALDATSAQSLFGTNSAELTYASGTGGGQSMDQDVTFLGTDKLNVDETYTFSIWCRSASAVSNANSFVWMEERDASALQDFTTTALALDGGEGWTRFEVSHTITDVASDRLRCHTQINDNVILHADGAQLEQTATATKYWVLNNNDGASGVESADDADSESYDKVGFDVDYIAEYNKTDIQWDLIQHTWAIVEHKANVWDYLQEIADASGALALRCDPCGTLYLRAVLVQGHEDAPNLETVSATRNIATTLELPKANKIVIHGIRVVKLSYRKLVWTLQSAWIGDKDAGGFVSDAIANGSSWPPDATYGPLWASYDEPQPPFEQEFEEIFRKPLIDDTPISKEVYTWTGEGPPTTSPPMTLNIPGRWFKYPKYKRRYRTQEIIGLRSPSLIWATDDGVGDSTAGSGGNLEVDTVGQFDTTTRADSARILLHNSSGSEVTLRGCVIQGLPVTRLSGDEGFVHDAFVDTERIAEEGEVLLAIGNNFIVTKVQTENLADYWWKISRGRKHSHILMLQGTQLWYEPGEMYQLTIGGAGEVENVDSKVVCIGAEAEQTPDRIGSTMVGFAEIEENWKRDSTATARFLASGNHIDVSRYR